MDESKKTHIYRVALAVLYDQLGYICLFEDEKGQTVLGYVAQGSRFWEITRFIDQGEECIIWGPKKDLEGWEMVEIRIRKRSSLTDAATLSENLTSMPHQQLIEHYKKVVAEMDRRRGEIEDELGLINLTALESTPQSEKSG